MNDNFNLEINDFGIINEANIEINKINVVGGVNASGKSTASKLLYCFLKANSVDIKDFVLASSLPQINRFINIMSHPDPSGINDFPEDIFSVEDLKNAAKLSKSVIEYLEKNGVLKGMSQTNQLTFFD